MRNCKMGDNIRFKIKKGFYNGVIITISEPWGPWCEVDHWVFKNGGKELIRSPITPSDVVENITARLEELNAL